MADPQDRLTGALRALIAELFPNLNYLGVHRYSVTACDYEAQTFDATPSLSASGLPPIAKVPIRSAVKVELIAGTSVLVGFAGANPSDPFLAHFDQLTTVAAAKLRATGQIEIGEAATQAAARQGDMTLSGGVGTQVMVALAASGDQSPQPVQTMTPLFISFGAISGLPPSFPIQGQLTGIVSTGSALVKEA